MALVPCKECGTEMSSTAKACPKCGAKPPSGPKWWLWVPLGLVVAFILFGATVADTPEAQERARERRAIELCWDEQKRKSLDPSAQRFVAGACEMMEQRFREKHGRNP